MQSARVSKAVGFAVEDDQLARHAAFPEGLGEPAGLVDGHDAVFAAVQDEDGAAMAPRPVEPRGDAEAFSSRSPTRRRM